MTKTSKYSLGLYSKSSIFNLSHELEKVRSPDRATLKYPKSLCELGKNLEVQPTRIEQHWNTQNHFVNLEKTWKYSQRSHSKLNIMNEIFHCHRFFVIREGPGCLYWLLDVFPKQAKCEIKALQVQAYIWQSTES